MLRHSSLCTDVDWSLLNVNESAFVMSGCHSSPIALQRCGPSPHVCSGARSLDSLMEEFSARLNALEQGIRDRDAHIQHLNNMLTQQQTTTSAQSFGTYVTQPDLHREMLARVKEFDAADDKWSGWWCELHSFLKANHADAWFDYNGRKQVTQNSAQCGSRGRCNCPTEVVGGVSARHRQPSLGSGDEDHELDDSGDRSDHCNQRAGFENHCLRIAER